MSPHCDSSRKLSSHIFYFNTEEDWKPECGGETVILDDGGHIGTRSAPAFGDFDRALSSVALGNHSLIFTRPRELVARGARDPLPREPDAPGLHLGSQPS